MTPINSEDKPTNSDYVALWQLQDIEETIQDASPEEMPELYDKLEALSSGLTEAMQKLITADRKRVALEAVKAYEDDLLSTIDDISNKPWRAARHIRELYENTDSGISDWYKEVADDWGLLEEFFSNGGMGKVRELMADPKFNVNYPERIAELKAQQEEVL